LVLAAVGLAAIVWLLIAVKCRFDSARADLASRAGARGTSIGKATAGWWPAEHPAIVDLASRRDD